MLGLHHGKKDHCIFPTELQVSLKLTKTNPFSGSQDPGKSREVVKKMNPSSVAESDKSM